MRPDRFRREVELLAEGTGKGLVRTITRAECDGQDIRRAGHEMPRCLSQTAPAHITHDRLSGGDAERTQQVVARDTAGGRDVRQGQLVREMYLDEPQRFSDGMCHCRFMCLPAHRTA